MKSCPYCDAQNEDDAFYCRECDNPIPDPSRRSASSPSNQEGELKLTEELPPPTTPPPWATLSDSVDDSETPADRPKPLLGRAKQTRPQVHAAEPAARPVRAKPWAGPVILVLFLVIVLLGAALAYLILYEEALKKKADFDNQLAQIMIDHSKRFDALETEIESSRKQYEALLNTLTETKKENLAETERLQATINEFIEGKIPGLHPITLDGPPTVFEQDIRYSVQFKRHGSAERALRYEVSLENMREQPIVPSPMELIIFSDKGFQIGSSTIALLDEFTLEEIPPAGSKLTVGSIRLKPTGKPAFFLIVPQ